MIMDNKIFFENTKGYKICGILSDPSIKNESRADTPITVLCHGLSSGKDCITNQRLVAILSQNNIATFRFDFSGHGESEGKIEEANIEQFTGDILSAINHLNGIGYERIGLYAGSLGGPPAVIASSKEKILYLTLKSPGMGGSSRKMPNFLKDFNEGAWFKAAEHVRIPTLIVHGSADDSVELSQSEKLAMNIPSCTLRIILGADHKYSREEDFEKMIKYISEFIIQQCRS
jgi:uncharacterized protein